MRAEKPAGYEVERAGGSSQASSSLSDADSPRVLSGEPPALEHSTPGHAPAEANGAARVPENVPSATIQPVFAEAGTAAVPGGFSGIALPGQAKKRRGKTAAIACGVLAGALAIIYLAGALIFSNWFPPNTRIGDIDASLKSSAEVQALLGDAVRGYRITVVGEGFDYRASSADLGITIDAASIVDDMHRALNPWAWPVLLAQGAHDQTDQFATSSSAERINEDLASAIERHNETAEAPVDATIGYREGSGAFEVVPEQAGTQLDVAAVTRTVDEAILTMREQVSLGAEHLAKPQVLANNPALAQAARDANVMVSAKLELVMGGKDAGTVDADDLAPLVSLSEDLHAQLDEDALSAWVDDLINGFNTVESTRTYTRPDGKQVTVSGGTYGWEVDAPALAQTIVDDVLAGAQGRLEIPCSREGSGWNGPGAQDWGPRYADIDLSEQHSYLFDENGEVIWESDIISGEGDDPFKATPEGVWYINRKATNETLRTYEQGATKPHETLVKYWMPFIGNLVAFHDAWWQPGFGGDMYLRGYGSHGCINLPSSKAAELYDVIQVGDVVTVHW